VIGRIIGILAILAIVVWIFFPRPTNPYHRETYVIVSDPMIILSWGKDDNTLTTIALPADLAADGTHGYGTYSLSAFWRLGQIDNKDGTVLAESVSEALGIPIDGYIGAKNGDSITQSVFSLGNSIGFLSGAYRTNIPLSTFVSLSWRLNFSKPDRVNTFDFTQNTSAIAQDNQLPDGSTQYVMDPERVDAELANVFEDDAVRQEPITAAVYNTTAMPSLGNRVGRLLTNLGVSVVTVGNDAPQVNTCTLTGSATALKSKSAGLILAVLGCKPIVGATTRADLLLRVGSSYAKRFVPN
jgi:hypothetical protein